ncbi:MULTISPECIES: OXA-42 family class D beta-lactamase [unclassified Burkholderia]|uniref:OXA-42 family class D beta-lactamase n=1 Tax=unclassified Burkholderia TaxID=2613784 RepID=UPI00075F644A|nr:MULTISPECIES: OXA-42 family class D beta-lactamase [unclassified Burkholderia]KVN07765.1 class D beta-lactamase [Burkholderia sp. MSMB1552]KWZ49722.1 class D beta-lactamase [Burkholderia sp. MSMB1588]
MKIRHALSSALVLLGCAAAPAYAKTLCTAIADATTGKFLLKDGDCSRRATPASTFKIAMSLMGYDAGFLRNEHEPVLPYRDGYVDWGGAAWKQPTDPTRWLKYSVVWYSQQITHHLGAQRVAQYAKAFGYGNADLSGDPGKNNGLDRAWIGSSLQISPLEQIGFLRRMLNRDLPVSANAIDMTERIVDTTTLADGTIVHGKTGMAYPLLADGTRDKAHGFGWFVGWIKRGKETLVFASLTQDERKEPGSTGVRTRDAFLRELPQRLAAH